jgi:molybdenum cofactor guanylyltransferase
MRNTRALPERLARQYHTIRNLDEYITTAFSPKPGAAVEGAILAGGGSRRMGRDKLFLRFGDKTALELVSDAIRPLVGRLRLIGREPAPDLPAAEPDIHPGLGPLSGIETALATSSADRILVVACDLPLVTTPFLRGLVEALSTEHDAVVPSPGGEPIPVCAVYRVGCLEGVTLRLARRELSAQAFVRSLKTRFLDDLDLARLDPSRRCLFNLNTPQDLDRARAILRNESKT